jgi:two-component sensor histidine kinase/integral membrane sensor domain MASE1
MSGTLRHIFQVVQWWAAGWTSVLRAVVVACTYLALAKAALTLASLHPSASPVWPPSGLALASFLLWGNRLWPAIAAGAFLANVTTAGSLFTSSLIAGGNTLEALITASLLKRWTASTNTFETPLQVVLFAGLALAPGTMVSATVGVGSLVLAGFAEPAKFFSVWITWWLGDVGGQLLITPFIVLWFKSSFRQVGRVELQRLAVLLAATIIVGLVSFSPLIEETSVRGPLAFLVVAPLLWSALRNDQRDTATVSVVLCAFAIWGTLSYGGPFAGANLNDSFLLVIAFVISTTVPSLVLSADVAVRRLSEDHKNLLIAELDHRVKNVLAGVAAVAQLSRESSRSANEFLDVLNARINSLAKTHALLSRSHWQGVSLDELVRSELAFCANNESVAIEGPQVDLAAEAVQPVAMVLHELATNATKYGALSNCDGKVLVRWRQQSNGRKLVLEWRETGGPHVAAPAETGYGTGVIRDIIPYELGGAVDFELAPEGARCRLEIPGQWFSNQPSTPHAESTLSGRVWRAATSSLVGSTAPMR